MGGANQILQPLQIYTDRSLTRESRPSFRFFAGWWEGGGLG
jgi:hypothetical protein